jgi:2-oxoisovalerate dehydrogenase E1 component
MAVARAAIVEQRLLDTIRDLQARPPQADLSAPVRPGTSLTGRHAIKLFNDQIESRLLDMIARDLKKEGQSFYTIGSSGHEGNAAVAAATRSDDPAFLHYRSGAFFLSRANATPGTQGAFDVLLGLVASADEPIAGGRHKVFGSAPLCIPPQTSTIASHLPKAVGCAIALDRGARFEDRIEERIVICSFGDASSNHASATTALNGAAWSSYQHIPAPILFVCEDNGLGISVRTPRGWIKSNLSTKTGIEYFHADGLDLPDAYDQACAAAAYVRNHRKPALLHLRTVRLLGHAGSDVELLYRTKYEIEKTESLDPLIHTAQLLIEGGWLSPDQVLSLYEGTKARLVALSREAVSRPKITTREVVMAPLHPPVRKTYTLPQSSDEARDQLWNSRIPESTPRQRHMAMQLNRALTDIFSAIPNTVLFGEDVARKGGVYHVTNDLMKKFGVGRVFNTMLDETNILGLAIGAAHAGLLPFPEIQYLAYLMNAIDQLRGEAGSMQFFSQGQFHNGMVMRMAGLAYQKGFGGHFHNDNGVAALLEIPGLVIGIPSRGDDAAMMLRTLTALALHDGRVCVNLEPIALYMTKDLHEAGDELWLTDYPPPDQMLEVGTVRTYGEGTDLTIATYANGLYMSLRVAKRLEAEGIHVRIVDLRWLSPLPITALIEVVKQTDGKLLVVDECRASSGIANTLAAEVYEALDGAMVRRVTAPDSYIPLAAAANLVLVQEHDIEAGIRQFFGGKA